MLLRTLLMVLILCWSSQAFSKARVAVGAFSGAFAGDVRKAAVDALEKQGVFAMVADEEATLVGYAEVGTVYVDAINSFRAVGIVVGRVANSANEWSLTVQVFGPEGQELETFKISGSSSTDLNKKVAAELPEKVEDLLEDFEPPDLNANGTADDGADEADDDGPKGDLPSPFEVSLAPGFSRRDYSYVNSSTDNSDLSNTGLSWESSLRAYPGALLEDGVLGHIGLELAFETGFPRQLVANDSTYRAQAGAFYISPRARIPIGRHELGLLVGYGSQHYKLLGDEGIPCPFNTGAMAPPRTLGAKSSCIVPDVTYKFLRFGADARFWIDEVMIGLHAGYRVVVGAGELESVDWFASASGGAVQGQLELGYKLTNTLQAVLWADYTRYMLTFDSVPPGRIAGTEGGPVADGAVDQYMLFSLGVLFILPPG